MLLPKAVLPASLSVYKEPAEGRPLQQQAQIPLFVRPKCTHAEEHIGAMSYVLPLSDAFTLTTSATARCVRGANYVTRRMELVL